MNKNECEFCKRCFSSPQNLGTHKKTAKYCLALRVPSALAIVDMSSYKCDYCNQVYSQKHSLLKHQNSCPGYNEYLIENLKEQLEEKNNTIHEQKMRTIKLLKARDAKIAEKDAEIAELKEKISYEKGMVAGMEKTIKPPKIVVNNNNKIINKKLAAIPTSHIQPLTLEYVKSKVDEYDYMCYKRGKKGIKQYIENLIIVDMDGVIQQNYACTDRSRNAFHRLVTDKEWKMDGGARFINSILDSLIDRVTVHEQSLKDEIKMLGGPGVKADSLMRLDTELSPIYGGVINPKGKERIDLFESIRNDIRDMCSVPSSDG